MEKEKKPNKFAYIAGQIVGYVLVGCVSACLCGLMVGLTAKFLMWIF